MNYTKVLLTPKQLIYKLNSISKDIREEEFIDYTLHFENKGLVFPIGKFEVDNTNKMILLKSGDMMTEKRFELGKSEDGALLWIIDNTQLNNGYDGELSTTESIDLLNKQEEQIQELKYEKEKVVKTLKQYFDRYTQMAMELRHDKYGNGVCHDVTEVIMEIADKLDINIIDW